MLTPPAPAGVAENSSSPVEEFFATMLLCMFTKRSKQYGSCVLIGSPTCWHEPGSALVVEPATYAPGNSPWPTLMPPERVPELLTTRLLAICRLWPQPCTKMPPPPCELLVMVMASILEGLQ